MTIYSFSTLTNNQSISFDPLHDILKFDTATRPAELLINGTLTGVQISVGGKSISLAHITLDDLGISSATSAGNVQFVSPGALLVGEVTTDHNGDVANLIVGGSGDDALLGLGGNDTLDGGTGGDLMVGGLGNDTFKVDNVNDVVTEENNSLTGAGIDTVLSLISYTLTNYVENLTLVGTGNINGSGNTLDNLLIGTSGDNTLDGKTNALSGDTMIGGNGNDTYYVDSAYDQVIETNIDATQIDTVQSGVSYRLGANLENLGITNIVGKVGVGNYLSNQMTGSIGNDTLNGGRGDDTMTGGDGNDVYFVNSTGDQVVEISNSLSQIDTVFSTISYTAGANQENIRLYGSADINATGNALNNVLYANAGSNVIDGQGGNDTASWADFKVYGLAASLASATTTSSVTTSGVTVDLNIAGFQDTQGSGFDKLIGIENLTGSQFNDELTGNTGNNILDGYLGADVMTGGRGNDTYYVDGADVVVELSGAIEGIDTVVSSVSYRLTANVENLTLILSAESGIGNNLDNRLVGTNGNNFLDGRAGADKMDGGSGNDTFVVDNLGDEVTDGSGAADLVMTYVNYNLGDTIENLRLMGINALNGVGNASNNIVWANIADNTVDGGGQKLVGNFIGDTLSYEYGATGGVKVDLSLTGPQVTGGSGVDTIMNFEHLTGSNYDDVLSGDSGVNILDGLTGVDTVSYASATAAVNADLNAGTATSIIGTTTVIDKLLNFDNLTGSSYDDTLTGDVYDNVFDGGDGLDTVSYAYVALGDGGVVVNLALAGAQNTIAAGFDTFLRAANSTRSSVENLVGTVNDDNLTGDAFANRLDGSEGNDILHGGLGDDALIGGPGNDLIDGGQGTDTAFFLGTQDAVVNLNLVAAQNTGFGLDTLSSIENVTSDAGNDMLTGNTVANALDGAGGQDTIYGGDGDDSLTGGMGNDLIDGGQGNDTAFFVGTQDALVNLTLTVAQNTGYGQDLLTSIENVTSGEGADRLTGNGGANILSANFGNDTIDGGGGADILSGGAGTDQLTGGNGADIFVFNTAFGIDNIDTIVDFVTTDDTFQLENAVFAGLAAGALAGTAFAANAAGTATQAVAQIIYETDTGKLFFDADGTGGSLAVQFAVIGAGLSLTAADFFVI